MSRLRIWSMVLDVRLVGRWLTKWVLLHTVKQCGFGDIPVIEGLVLPYSIVDLLPSPRPEGPWSHPDDHQELVFQITAVGQSPDQCGWMQTAIRKSILGRDAAGRYSNVMNPVSEGAEYTFSVTGRVSDGTGGIVKSGDRLFEVADTYRLKVSP